jgi:alpha-L-fucosidase
LRADAILPKDVGMNSIDRIVARACAAGVLVALSTPAPGWAQAAVQKDAEVKAEHDAIGNDREDAAGHTRHPDALWFPNAALGLFLHWDPASVKGINIGWSVIPGRKIAARSEPFSREEVDRIIREGDYDLDGKPWAITPREYWNLAKDFKPDRYDPEKWMKAAKAAGFRYAVITTKHHNGFALWPSHYGDFNTKNYMGGRDLLKEFVKACRDNGIKVGFYFSAPDWYFERDFKNFFYAARQHPEFGSLDENLRARTTEPTAEQKAAHEKAYAAMVRGQIEELLTQYGKIDVLWFDGRPPVPEPEKIVTIEEIRKWQPGIVINPRMHGHGDYKTYERRMDLQQKSPEWAEFCQTWTNNWSYVPQEFRANGFILGELVRSRSLGVNYLLGIGPMPSGELEPDAYKNMAVVADWMKTNGRAVVDAGPLPDGESASVPATASASARYLFALPKYGKNRDANRDALPAMERDLVPPVNETLTLKIAAKPKSATLLADGKPVEFSYANGTVTLELPAARRTNLVDVVRLDL